MPRPRCGFERRRSSSRPVPNSRAVQGFVNKLGLRTESSGDVHLRVNVVVTERCVVWTDMLATPRLVLSLVLLPLVLTDSIVRRCAAPGRGRGKGFGRPARPPLAGPCGKKHNAAKRARAQPSMSLARARCGWVCRRRGLRRRCGPACKARTMRALGRRQSSPSCASSRSNLAAVSDGGKARVGAGAPRAQFPPLWAAWRRSGQGAFRPWAVVPRLHCKAAGRRAARRAKAKRMRLARVANTIRGRRGGAPCESVDGQGASGPVAAGSSEFAETADCFSSR